PYELHDFFLFHFLRFGASPEKLLFLAREAGFERGPGESAQRETGGKRTVQTYPPEEIRRWLREFIGRFFANQFKRSCLPDGPKVGSVSLSPRGDWRMPSDAQAHLWLQWLQAQKD